MRKYPEAWRDLYHHPRASPLFFPYFLKYHNQRFLYSSKTFRRIRYPLHRLRLLHSQPYIFQCEIDTMLLQTCWFDISQFKWRNPPFQLVTASSMAGSPATRKVHLPLSHWRPHYGLPSSPCIKSDTKYWEGVVSIVCGLWSGAWPSHNRSWKHYHITRGLADDHL